jgi:hypothetical protein
VRTKTTGLIVLLSILVVLGGCGYYFPHIYNGPERVLYLPNWKNRTNQLDLDAKIYQSLSSWFQKAKAINTTKTKEGADLLLAGEIISIDLPSISWAGNRSASEIQVRLDVRYILKDLNSGKILWEVPHEMWTEEYSTSSDSSGAIDNENKALEKIIDDLSEGIYLHVLNKLRKLDSKKQ